MKTCACGRYISEVSSRCKCCTMRARWGAGGYDAMIASRGLSNSPPGPRIDAMRRFISRGSSVYRAAKLVFDVGLGPSLHANYSLWRSRKAMDMAEEA